MNIGFFAVISIASLLNTTPYSTPSLLPSDQGIECQDLLSVAWSGFNVSVAEDHEAEEGVPAHCLVRGTMDAEIRFELILPAPDAWNGRFVMGGGGGFVGTVENQVSWLAPEFLARGFASVGTDTGHQGTAIDASWAMDRKDREIDFGFRAVHVTAETAKTIIRLHYGRDIGYSYFLGCSRGGGQAMMESQRFPDDFDGIVSGAPAYDWTGLAAQMVQTQQAMYPNSADLTAPAVTPEVRQLVLSAILEKCDALDGLEDGILSDPRDCGFEPGDLPRCPSGGTSESCVTEQQIRSVEAVYGGAFSAGERIYPGIPLGAETDEGGWDRWITGSADLWGSGTPNLHFAFGTQFFKYLVFDDPEWDYVSYDFSTWAADTRRAAGILNATNTDLTAFEIAGGKLILWHGWSDAGITALGTIQYYEAVRQEHADAESFVRLFLLPGVGHCAGGSGPDQVDWLSAIQAWVEEGEPPARLIATKRGEDGAVQLERPVCAYPARAQYTGIGGGTREGGFKCVMPSGGQ